MYKFKIFLAAFFATALFAQGPEKSVHYSHPLIKGSGGIVEQPNAAEQPKKNSKVIIDITSDQQSGTVIKGLDRAALITNQYAAKGVGPKDEDGLEMVIILHGAATKSALSHEAYLNHASSYARQGNLKGNPNLELMNQLRDAGVQIYVCGQALAHHGFTNDEVAGNTEVAVSAATVNINRQMAGYAYLPFH